jgi:hypothetical protein
MCSAPRRAHPCPVGVRKAARMSRTVHPWHQTLLSEAVRRAVRYYYSPFNEPLKMFSHEGSLAEVKEGCGFALPAIDDSRVDYIGHCPWFTEQVEQFLVASINHLEIPIPKLARLALENSLFVACHPDPGRNLPKPVYRLNDLIYV